MGHGRQPPCSDSKRHPLGKLFFWLMETCSGGEKSGAALTSLRGVDRERAALIRASITSRSVSHQTGTSFPYPKSVLALFVLYIGCVWMMASLTSETRLVSTPKMASETPASRLSEAHRALSSARALSIATKKINSDADGLFAGEGRMINLSALARCRSGENGNAPCLGFGGRRFFLLVFVVGGYQHLCELKKDALSARGDVRVCLVGTATPFDEPRGPICKADVVGRLFCCCCCCCRCCRRIHIVRVGFRVVDGRIVIVGE